MQIHALSPDSSVDIVLNKGDNSVALQGKVCGYSREVVKFASELSQRTMVPFTLLEINSDARCIAEMCSSGWHAVVSAVVNNKYYEFIPEKVCHVAFGGGKQYLVVFDLDNADANDRRGAHRFPIDVEGILFINGDFTPYVMLLQDLSMTGAGVVVDDNVPAKVGDEIFISFVTEEQSQAVRGTVVRVAARGTRKLLGCTIRSEDLA